jgi:monoterpene epsilon-lactone hydrolase
MTSPINLPPLRQGRPAPEDLVARRGMIGLAPNKFPPVEGLKVAEERIAGVRVLRISLGNAPRGTVVHLHGGGFRLGAPETYVGFASHLAAHAGVEVIAPAYRLAPENPYPAGLSDALAVVEALSDAERGRLVLSGDSAGGGLATSLTRLVLSRGITPKGLMVYAPWVDMTVSRPSYEENTPHDTLFSLAAAQQGSEQYLQGHSRTDPLVSPVFGDVSDFPPTLISVGAHEVLRDDALALAEALQTSRRDVVLINTPHMEHVAPTRDPNLTGAAESIEATVKFLGRVLP